MTTKQKQTKPSDDDKLMARVRRRINAHRPYAAYHITEKDLRAFVDEAAKPDAETRRLVRAALAWRKADIDGNTVYMIYPLRAACDKYREAKAGKGSGK